jgi:hypothetical protein
MSWQRGELFRLLDRNTSQYHRLVSEGTWCVRLRPCWFPNQKRVQIQRACYVAMSRLGGANTATSQGWSLWEVWVGRRHKRILLSKQKSKISRVSWFPILSYNIAVSSDKTYADNESMPESTSQSPLGMNGSVQPPKKFTWSPPKTMFVRPNRLANFQQDLEDWANPYSQHFMTLKLGQFTKLR